MILEAKQHQGYITHGAAGQAAGTGSNACTELQETSGSKQKGPQVLHLYRESSEHGQTTNAAEWGPRQHQLPNQGRKFERKDVMLLIQLNI